MLIYSGLYLTISQKVPSSKKFNSIRNQLTTGSLIMFSAKFITFISYVAENNIIWHWGDKFLCILIDWSWCPWVAIITSASSSTNTRICFKSKNRNFRDQSKTFPGVPIMIWSVILEPLESSSPLTAYRMVSSGANCDILLATSPVCNANSYVGERHNTYKGLLYVYWLI